MLCPVPRTHRPTNTAIWLLHQLVSILPFSLFDTAPHVRNTTAHLCQQTYNTALTHSLDYKPHTRSLSPTHRPWHTNIIAAYVARHSWLNIPLTWRGLHTRIYTQDDIHALWYPPLYPRSCCFGISLHFSYSCCLGIPLHYSHRWCLQCSALVRVQCIARSPTLRTCRWTGGSWRSRTVVSGPRQRCNGCECRVDVERFTAHRTAIHAVSWVVPPRGTTLRRHRKNCKFGTPLQERWVGNVRI